MARSRFNSFYRTRAGLAGVWVAVVLAGCAANPEQPTVVPDPVASGTGATPGATTSDAAADAGQGAAGAGATTVVTKTVFYKVRRGDTLQRVAQSHGCPVKDLAAWNRLKPSSRIKPGQTLRIVSRRTVPVQAKGGVDTHGVASAISRHASAVSLAWPAQGQVVESFQPGENRGIEIGGKEGDPVRAAADGKVMFAGTGLNEYGSLIIVQHNKDFLTAYSHSRRLLVKTGDIVRQGQQIAEMGADNRSRAAVLFEVRRDGKPVDPMAYLRSQNG
ncbi:peptidoglycan DD-metalloendopeptidase family protein [Paraburkholderia kururiensis]|uniref:peptidoglycan DD-metalloendopeptidase family protein n=1 Tax=Paraburkholderia kururiensis TaxID=984307 RepID=UPI000F866BD4|nr:peptidoglycan DD-metalloendopeptidase family protein [Paraburkholderia kururiensis]